MIFRWALRMKYYGHIMLVFLLLPSLAIAGDDKPGQIVEAVMQRTLMPQFGDQLDLNSAYALQFNAVTMLLAEQRPDGFKAGLTSRAGQEKFGVRQPVAGVLLAASQLNGKESVLSLAEFNQPMMELELGFKLSTRLTEPVRDIETLKKLVVAVYPVMELPDLGFQHMPSLRGTDIIANNVAARGYLLGEPTELDARDINALSVELYRDGELIMAGKGSDARGDQWQALLWLLNQSLENGWVIEPNQLLITGALGKMLPAKAGKYRASFGDMGELQWQFR